MWAIEPAAAARPETAMFAPPAAAGLEPTSEEDRQPDVAEHEPEQASGERHEEAPEADRCEDQPVHPLEYVP